MAATFASDLLQSAQLYRTVFDHRLETVGLTSESYVLLQAAADWNGRPWRFLTEWPATPTSAGNEAILQEFIALGWLAMAEAPGRPDAPVTHVIDIKDAGMAKLEEAMAVERRLAAEILVGTEPEGLSALAGVFATMQENLGSIRQAVVEDDA